MINCLIVDDEPLALSILEDYVNKTPYLHLAGKCNGVVEVLKFMEDGNIDLLFLDIQMPEITGLEFSQTLVDKIKVIFTTAFDQYALEGFKVNALGYLLKPFSYQEFLEAANRAKEWFELTKRADQKADPSMEEDGIFVKSEYKLIKIKYNEILYIEGLKDYVKFYLAGKEWPILTLMSLKILQEKLPKKKFMRVHRSFIVALDKIQTIERNEIVFGKIGIPVADKYKDEFNEFVAGRSFK